MPYLSSQVFHCRFEASGFLLSLTQKLVTWNPKRTYFEYHTFLLIFSFQAKETGFHFTPQKHSTTCDSRINLKYINIFILCYVNSSILVMLFTEFIKLYSHRITYQLIWKLSQTPVSFISLSSRRCHGTMCMMTETRPLLSLACLPSPSS